MIANIKALGKNVIVTVDYDTKYKGTIIIPDTAVRYKQEFYAGKIVSVGKKCPYDLKKGDRVLIRQYESGHEGKRFRYPFPHGEVYWTMKWEYLEAKVLK